MVAQLEIRDGTPWYNSQDVWVVPHDPSGQSGLPVVGQPAYLWALVHNTGMETAQNAVVTFYVADPSTKFDRNSALKIGTGNVSLDPGMQAEVLCLAPWTPTFFNGGHECILAEVFPALTTPPSPIFNVPTDNRVAQRNLSVLTAAVKQIAHLAFEIPNTARTEQTFRVIARRGETAELRAVLPRTGLDERILGQRGELTDLGFVTAVCPTDADLKNVTPDIRELRLGPGARAGFSLVGRLAGDAALVYIEQLLGDQVVGGISVLFLARKG